MRANGGRDEISPSSGRTRLLLVLPDLRGGGAERTAVNLAHLFDDERFEVNVGLFERTGELIDEVPPARLLGRSAGRLRPRRDSLARGIQDVARAHALLGEARPHVVMTSMPDATIPMYLALAAKRRRGVRFVVREGNNTAVVHRRLPLLERAVVWRLIARVYASADAVIVPSEGVREGLVASFAVRQDAVTVIPNPVRIGDIASRAREPVAVALPERFIVGVGRLVEQKGFDLLLRAVATAPELERFAIVLVGEGPERPRLERLARQLGLGSRLVLTGFLPNPWAVAARATVFAVPSRWEGFGHVVVEAMAIGVPVVVSDCDWGPRESVRDGIDGWIHRSGDVAALRRALVEAALDETRAAARRRSALVRAQAYDAVAIAKRYAEVLSPRGSIAP